MCPVMIITIYFEADHKKLVSSQKSSIFGPQKGHFVQSGPRNGPPSGQTATYQKTKGIQSSLRIWRSCHPIESGPSEPKKWGFHRCSVKKCRISGQKCSFLAQNPFFCQKRPTFLLPSWPDNKKTTFLCWPRCTAGLGAAVGAILSDFGRLWQFLTNAKKWHFLGFALSSHHFF